jgi:hypothetical protein
MSVPGGVFSHSSGLYPLDARGTSPHCCSIQEWLQISPAVPWERAKPPPVENLGLENEYKRFSKVSKENKERKDTYEAAGYSAHTQDHVLSKPRMQKKIIHHTMYEHLRTQRTYVLSSLSVVLLCRFIFQNYFNFLYADRYKPNQRGLFVVFTVANLTMLTPFVSFPV